MTDDPNRPLPTTARETRMEGASLIPQDFVDLFFRPSRFYAAHHDLSKGPYLTLVVLIVGLNGFYDRVSRSLDRQIAKGRMASIEEVDAAIGAWAFAWPILLLGGVMYGAGQLYVGGWWFRKRLEMVGAKGVEEAEVRRIYIYAMLILALPLTLDLILATFNTPSFLTYYLADASPLLIFALLTPFWSVAISYAAVKTRYGVSGGKARFWFAIGPILVYAMAMGLMLFVEVMRAAV